MAPEPKSPSPRKGASYAPYSRDSPRKLAQPVGGWITKTDAKTKYKLAPSDLATILPISSEPNPRGGPNRIERFNIADVQALAERLQGGGGLAASSSASTTSQGELAVPNGPKILRTRALKDFNLKAVQLDRLKPVSIAPNPHGRGPPLQHAIATSLAKGAEAPTRGKSYYTEDDYHSFDGLSPIDAAALLYDKTGIVDSSVFQDD